MSATTQTAKRLHLELAALPDVWGFFSLEHIIHQIQAGPLIILFCD